MSMIFDDDANYLVLSRTLVEAMPADWQENLARLLTGLRDRNGEGSANYQVRCGQWKALADCTAQELRICEVEGNGSQFSDRITGRVMSGTDRVFLPGDEPVAHYRTLTWVRTRTCDERGTS